MPSKIHNMMPNKHNKQKFESKIYTFGLATHYQLQKNFSKIELNLRQGCQLFTVYIFSSFCWLYLIRYSNKTNELAYSKVDFLFQDIFFETLPLLSEKGIVYGETNPFSSVTNREIIKNFDKQQRFSSNTNEKFVSIDVTPFFSEKLQNYIGRKPSKSQRLLNSTWKNEVLHKKETNFPISFVASGHKGDSPKSLEITSPLDLNDSSAVLAESRKQEHADCRNREQNHQPTGLANTLLSDLHSNNHSSQASTQSNSSKDNQEGLVPFLLAPKGPRNMALSRVSNKLNQNKILFSTSPNLLKTTKELIFFARKPIFIKVKPKSSTFPSIPTFGFSFTTKTSEHQKLVCFAYQQVFANKAFCAKPAQLNINILLKKQILTQKKAYNLSGTSMIMDPEIDFLPSKLEECVSFSKVGSHATHTKEKNAKCVKGEKGFSLDFKPHLTLTENLFWCKTLIKNTKEIWLNEAFPFENNFFLDAAGKSPQIAKTWLTRNSFSEKSLQLPLSFTKKKATKNVVLVVRPVTTTLGLSKKKQEHELIQKNYLSTATNKQKQKVTEELLHFCLKKKGFWKSKGQFIDIFNQPRLQSGFHFPNAPIVQKSKYKLKGGLGLTLNPRLLFLRKSTILTPQSLFVTNNQEIAQYKEKVLGKGGKTFYIEGQKGSLAAKESNFLKFPVSKTSKTQASAVTLSSVLEPGKPVQSLGHGSYPENGQALLNQEKEFFEKNSFLEWLYEPHPKSEYLSYSRANNKLINLQKKACQFVILDKHTDLKTSHCFLDQKLSSTKKYKTFDEKVFSYKRNSFSGLLDAPENFFGTPYLKLGERFTIEKLKSKNKMGTLYSIHSGDVLTPSKTETVHIKPYASTGTSLKTVFGKKQFTSFENQNSKKISKVQNLITNARLVTSWSKEPPAIKNLSKSWSSIELKDNNLFFSMWPQREGLSFEHVPEENQKVKGIHGSAVPKTTTNPMEKKLPSTWNKDFSKNAMLNKAKILKILYFKRISGKANRNITLPFKYYNPGIKRERNVEDTMLILEGYKKSRLFPTIHSDYRGIATQGLPFAIEIDKVIYTDQDVDLQSILGGMRQRTEKQRIAQNLSQPSSENLTTRKEKSQEKQEYSIRKKLAFGQKYRLENQKRRLSNYYPLCTSLAVCPQEAFPEKALGATNIVDINLIEPYTALTLSSRTKNLKGSIQTKGFYFEKLLCSGSFPFLNFINKENWYTISPSFLAKIIFFACTWYSYKLLATPLSQSTQFLPATFTEAVGLQSFQQKYRIIKGENSQLGFSFKNLAGAEKTLSELRDLIWTFRLVGTGGPNRKNNLFTLFPYIGSRFGQSRGSVFSKSRNRLLLAGPPGTGKTLLVKALAAEANLPVIVQPVSSLRMISGVENPVSALFHVARQIKPCIIFLDELDTLGNDVNVSTNNYTAEQKLGIRLARKYTYTLLLELDGLTSSTRDLLIIGATNRLETLNPALTRAGRFDTILDFNLPSQEVRTALFSFYLGKEQASQEKKYKISQTKNSSNLKRQKQKKTFLKKINFKLKKSNTKSSWLESYLAGKCYGLSHASIGTIINESALESMLMGSIKSGLSKPLHTLETLERAINSVKTLTSRMGQSTNSLSLNLGAVHSKHSKQNSFLLKKSNTNQLTINLKSQKEQKNKDSFTQAQEVSGSIKPFQPEFLVNRVYQIVGSLIFQKSQEKNNRNSFFRQNKKPFYKASWPMAQRSGALNGQIVSHPKKAKQFNNLTWYASLTSSPKGYGHDTINQKRMPINRKDLQNVLLQEYSGYASLSIYTASKPLTFKILARAGLYQDPSYVAAILLTLRILTLQSSFYKECIPNSNFSSELLNEKVSLSQKLAKGDKTFLATSITKESFCKFSGFVKESNLPKVFFSDTSNLAYGGGQRPKVAQPQKSILFWKNRKVLKKNFSSLASDSGSFTKYGKQAPQTLLMDLKACNGYTTSWFRIYFSRPFFRYDTFHYIENKEYYPKNNYILKRNTLFQRNVSTLSHTTVSHNSHLDPSILVFPGTEKTSVDVKEKRSLTFKKPILAKFLTTETTEKKGKLLCKENRQGKYFNFYTHASEQSPVVAQRARKLEPTFFCETKESLYLAIVASIFHKGIQFFQKNRELTDYCAYTFLRYGVLYEFYLEAICQNF